ncbi:MAG: transglutaminase domain-containing protein, partial [Streptosporangiaceae bacterium]
EMVLLQNHLVADFRYDPRAAPGESYGHLALFLSGQRSGGPGVFATLFAVLARNAGFPARIAVGFSGGEQTAPGLYQVSTADALVWPEVYFRGLGWVPFYPLPRPGPHAPGQVVRSLGQPRSSSALDQQVARAGTAGRKRQHSTARVRVPGPASGQAGTGGLSWLWLAAGLGALAVILAYLAGAGLARTAARRRWRRGPPWLRISGAWQETLSRLTAAGAGPLLTLTPDEVAARCAGLLGRDAGPALERLAIMANYTLFGQVPPTPGDADEAWTEAALIGRAARRQTSWPRRAALLLRLAPPAPERPGSTQAVVAAGAMAQTGAAAAVPGGPDGD